jgi:hypothetical protein
MFLLQILGIALVVVPTYLLLFSLATVAGGYAFAGRVIMNQTSWLEIFIELALLIAGISLLAS